MSKTTGYHGRDVAWPDPPAGSTYVRWKGISETQRSHLQFVWIKQIADDYRALPALTITVVLKLLDLFDRSREDGAAWMEQKLLAKKSGVCVKTVGRIMGALVDRGHLAGDGVRGRSLSNVYRMVRKSDSSVPFNDEKQDSSVQKNRTALSKKIGQGCPTTSSYLNSSDFSSSNIDSCADAQACDRDNPDDRSDNLFQQEGVGEKEQAKRPKKKPNAEEFEKSFEHFWSLYPRQIAKGDAKKAFMAAVKSGANPVTIIDGARRFAEQTQRAGAEPRFVKYPAGWLRAERWADLEEAPPPARTGAASAIEGIFDALSDRRWRQ